VVAEVEGNEYIKVLDLSEDRISLLSMNEKYEPMIVDEDTEV
jgi:SOS-response transcriptional repressor LexA